MRIKWELLFRGAPHPGARECHKPAQSIRPKKLDPPSSTVDFYQLLSVPKHASLAEIKSAYHRLLLQSHPDKRNPSSPGGYVDISLIKKAYTTLSNEDSRAAYDLDLKQRTYTSAGPRPAQVISLEEFEDENVEGEGEISEEGPWRYRCRCGGWYKISTVLMEKGEHLVACNSCSEVVWVGYEIVES
ncbi:DnaJ domain-containing protein [Pholiota molesta]|nr:DnaJ domain-containing protein [Pholiota molesta]